MSPVPYGFPKYEPVPQARTSNRTEYNVWNYLKLINYLGKLVESAGADRGATDDVDDEFRPHDVTYLKLLLLWTYTLRFFQFGKKASSWYYIDLLSASGLNYTKSDPNDPIPGSCFIVPLADQRFYDPARSLENRFQKVYCLDMSPDSLARIETRRAALEAKFGLEFPPYSYHSGDANAAIDKVLDEIELEAKKPLPKGKLGPLGLVFVDNLGLDISLDTIKKIQKRTRADLVVHLPTRAIWRCINAAAAGVEQARLTAFFGGDAWREIKSEAEIPSAYHQIVQQATGHEFQDFKPVPIKGANSDFHLCIYVRHTSGTEGRNGWLSIIEKLAEECGKITHERIREVRDLAQGRRKTLSEYF
jgi:three-Cys-motif partner protein